MASIKPFTTIHITRNIKDDDNVWQSCSSFIKDKITTKKNLKFCQ